MSKSRLVKTTFQSGPDDGLAAVDVYKKDTSEVVNSYDATEPEAIDVLDSINGKADESNKEDPSGENASNDNPDDGGDPQGAGGEDGGDTGGGSDGGSDSPPDGGDDDPFGTMDPDTSNREITDDEIQDRLSDGDEELGQCLRDMDDRTTSRFKLDPSAANKVFGEFAGIKSKIPTLVPVPTIRNMATMVNNLSNGNYPSVIQDVGAKSGLIGSITNLTSALKLPGAFSKIAEFSGISPNILVDAARIGISTSLARGDLGAFKDVAKSNIASRMKYVIPNLSNRAISAMQQPMDVDLRNYGSFYNETRSALDTMDPSWSSYNRGNGSVINGSVAGNNPFFMKTMRASVTSSPLGLKPPRNNTSGNLIDIDYADITKPDVFSAIYGDEVSIADKARIIADWRNDTARAEAAERRKQDSYMLVMDEFDTTPVVETLRNDFPLLEISDTSQVETFEYTA